jgi:acyl-CoA thioesterase
VSHVFDDALELDPSGDGVLRGRTRPEWANMVGPFGGITAAVLLHSVEVQPDRVGTPVALTVNFAAPIADGEFDLVVDAVRTNRTNQHWYVQLRQDGEVKTTATAVFGIRRDTWTDTEVGAPDVPTPDGVDAEASTFATWFSNYDMRIVDGAIPASTEHAATESTTTMWVRDADPRPVDYASLSAMCDIFYPRIFLRRGEFVPAGTISLTTYFHADTAQLDAAGSDFLLGQARAHQFGGGFFDQTAHVWSRGGSLLATSHQLVYFKG